MRKSPARFCFGLFIGVGFAAHAGFAREGEAQAPHAPEAPQAPKAPVVEAPTVPTPTHDKNATPAAHADGAAKHATDEKPSAGQNAPKPNVGGAEKGAANATPGAGVAGAKPTNAQPSAPGGKGVAADGAKTSTDVAGKTDTKGVATTPVAGDNAKASGRGAPPKAITAGERPSLAGGGHVLRAKNGEVPPSLTMGALTDEIKRSPAEQERETLLKEREHMEEMTAAIANARADLRKETQRLESLTQKSKTDAVNKNAAAANDANAEAAAAAGDAGGTGTAAAKKTPLDTLAKALRGMRPEQAAQIVERLPRDLAADVFQRMPPADAGKVMGKMSPQRGAEVASEIASREPHKTEKGGTR